MMISSLAARLRPRSIQAKLGLGFIAAIFLVLLLVFVLMLSQQQRLIRSEWSAALQAQARLVATNSQAALDFGDTQEALRLLHSVESNPAILRARILIAPYDQTPFAEYAQNPEISEHATPAPPATGSGVEFHDEEDHNHIVVWAAIPHSMPPTSVELLVSLEPMHQAIWRTARESGLALLAVLGLFLWVAHRAAQRIAQPLLRLNQLMGHMADNPGLAERASTQGNDELAQLGSSLNHMIDRLQKRDRELQQYRENLEELVAQRTQALQLATQEAQEASRAKSDFVARMSHEIRTPMNAIVGLGKLLLKTTLTVQQRDYQEKVISASDMLLGLINDILDYSRMEAGKLQVERIDFELEQVLQGVSGQLALKAQQKGLELLFHTDALVPSHLQGDPLRLSQVLVNLTNNAIKFTEFGEIVVHIRLIKLEQQQATLEFSVRDTGMGIAPEPLAQLFTPFTQVDSSITRRFGGTGLGLAICQQLVELMGGHIHASSEVGRGSCFAFELQLPLGQTPAAAPRMAHHSPLAGKRALVVDDNTSAREILTAMLTHLGMHTDAVEDGPACVQRILQAHAAGQAYDLVLLDWLMPGMDGIETAHHLQAANLGNAPPSVLMVTAGNYEKLSPLASQVGLSHILTKPVSPSALQDAVLESMLGKLAAPTWAAHAATAMAAAATTPAAHDFSALAGARVLLVDDVELNRTVAQAFLAETGVVIDTAVHGLEAVEKILAQPYDLVLMDIQMPEMDGLTATRTIRQEARLKNLPIIAMTAHAMEGDRQRSLDAGMQDHLTKPINPDALFAAMLRWIAPRSRPLATAATPAPAPAPAPTPAPAPATAAMTIPALEGIDTAKGLSQCLGKPALYLRILGNFVKDFAASSTQLEQASAQADWPLARRTAHSLKSAAATLGADALSEHAKQLEHIYADNHSAPPALLHTLEQELQRVLALLRPIVQAADQEPQAPMPMPAPATDYGPVLDELQTYLEHDDAKALRCLDTLQHALAPQASADVLSKIELLRLEVEDIEYETALNILSDLRQLLRNK